MKISFDSNASRAELQLVQSLVVQFLNALDAAPETIDTADNPSTGTNTAEMFAKPLALVPPVNVSHLPEVAAPVPPVAGIERDAEGLPWDARIHASTKTKTAKGVWTSKRGMNDAALVQRVKAEIGATLPSATPQATIPAPVFPTTTPAAAIPSPVDAPALTLPATSFTLPPVATPPAPVAAPQTLGELMAAVGPLMATLQIAPNALQEAATAVGVPSLAMLATANRPDLVEAIWRKLQPAA